MALIDVRGPASRRRDRLRRGSPRQDMCERERKGRRWWRGSNCEEERSGRTTMGRRGLGAGVGGGGEGGKGVGITSSGRPHTWKNVAVKGAFTAPGSD